MLKQRIEMRLSDVAFLIAVSTEKSNYPNINLYYQDKSET